MVLNFDLNLPPVLEGTSASTDSWVNRDAAVIINPRSTPFETNKGLASSPIDVEEIDDDVELLSSSIPFLQGRNQPRRKRRLTVNLEEAIQIPPGTSGLTELETVDTLLSLNNGNNAERTSINRTSFDCQLYYNSEEGNETKRQKKSFTSSSSVEYQMTTPPSPPPPPSPPKEPTFSCPVCMSSLTDPCSTVCGHIFCQACIEAAIKARKQCPNCRRKLPSKKSFHRVYLPTTD